MSDPTSYCSIDEFGIVFDDQQKPVSDRSVLSDFFDALVVGEHFQLTSRLQGLPVVVEAFDTPLIARKIFVVGNTLSFEDSYGARWPFALSSLTVDEWDRFHGLTVNNIPFVMNSFAQSIFFDQLDEFDDQSITFQGTSYTLENYWQDVIQVENSEFWTAKYKDNNFQWDLGQAAEGLKHLLPRLKLPATRVAVVGGGGGHDAAFFAQQGHHVTLIDFSSEAIRRAQACYGSLVNLSYLEVDLFDLPPNLYGQFDLVFEHTCFCAINPSLRNEAILQWRRLLNDNGFLFGLFFVMPQRGGPPFGGSEWELRQRLQSHFKTMIWQRFRHSIPPRRGRELLIYAQKKTILE